MKSVVNPTRLELSNVKKKLKISRRGHKLLKDKRDEMMRKFLERAKETIELRQNVQETLKKLSESYTFALAKTGREQTKICLLQSKGIFSIKVSQKNILNVKIPVIDDDTEKCFYNQEPYYESVICSLELNFAKNLAKDVLSKLLLLAQLEKECTLIGTELEKTRRRVNALEHLLIPQYDEMQRFIKMKLEENDRANVARLMKVKEMIL